MQEVVEWRGPHHMDELGVRGRPSVDRRR
jgi:hypothetical protein